jgi:Flp pilus assembly protein TadG
MSVVQGSSVIGRLRSFARHSGGNVSLLFGVSMFPLLAASGVAIDYGASSNVRTKLASIADAAALVGASKVGKPYTEKAAAAEAEFKSMIASQGLTDITSVKFIELKEGIRVEANASVKPKFMGIFGVGPQVVAAAADAQLSMGNVEIALVLDNTGSMVNDMIALRDAAKSFTETVFTNTAAGGVRMSLVPYSASVNVGRLNMPMSAMDTGANSAHHAISLVGRRLGYIPNCKWVGESGWNPPDPGGSGKKGVSLPNPTTDFADAARELLGISSAHAQAVVTPGSDISTAVMVKETVSSPYVSSPTVVDVPVGYSHKGHPCGLYNPPKISHFDLFNRIKGAQWKGCVEARPEPFDVNDEPANAANPNTLFVPYFWPDEPDDNKNWPKYENNYLPDGPSPAGWVLEYSERQGNLFKYDGKATAVIKETAPDTSGPNKACGQALTPLTDNRSTILNEVNSMSHWNGGGTISSEGLMWGWRTLSPRGPFSAKGLASDKVKKYIVLMTDGENTMGEQDKKGPLLSEYGAYGYLAAGRFPIENYAQMEKYLDSRMDLACANAKAAGITIMTILFRVSDVTVKKRLEQCASSSTNAYIASDADSLKKAFSKISGNISSLRLVK